MHGLDDAGIGVYNSDGDATIRVTVASTTTQGTAHRLRMSEAPLPSYDSPPVIETVLGVQFDALENLTAPVLGLFWSTLRDDWPQASEASYLESQFERFGTDRPWNQMRLELKKGHPPFRVQMRNAASDFMVQVQNSRLHVNWMGYEGAEYPRYPVVRRQFEQVWQRFTEFVDQEKLGEISPNQWEVTYLNRIPAGTVWQTPGDWSFLRLLGDPSVLDQTARFEGFQGGWLFALPEDAGRLHVSWKTGRGPMSDVADAEPEVVVLEQTARGPLSNDSGTTTIVEGLDTGHSAIVRSFSQLMSDQANAYWKRRS